MASVNVRIRFDNIPENYKERINDIMADGRITDREIVELMDMKLGGPQWRQVPTTVWIPRYQFMPEIVGRISWDRPLRRKLVWLAIVTPAVILALERLLHGI